MMSGIPFLALAVLSVAVFVGATWLLFVLPDLGTQRGAVLTEGLHERTTTNRRAPLGG